MIRNMLLPPYRITPPTSTDVTSWLAMYYNATLQMSWPANAKRKPASRLRKLHHRLDEFLFLLKHRQVPAAGDQLHLRLRQMLLVRLPIRRRHQPIALDRKSTRLNSSHVS